MNTRLIACSYSVREAQSSGTPIVALESTLLAHGLPWPANLQTALDSQAAVREKGAEPATIAIVGGRLCIGLDDAQLEYVARSGKFIKASRRDIALAISKGMDAATTVSATIAIAMMAGLTVMATGGLGGVHRNAGHSFDVSGDLDALQAASGMLVVCSGAKNLLDISATLEVLETRGLPVVGYQTDTFPAFTSTSSGLPLDWRTDSPQAAAAMWSLHRALGLPGALILAQPVPVQLAVPFEDSERAIACAMRSAANEAIRGKQVTPYLLNAVREFNGERTLEANRALIVANAALAAEVAVAAKALSDAAS